MSKFCVYANGFVGNAEVHQDVLVNSRVLQSANNATVDITSNSAHPVNSRIVSNYVTLLRNPSIAQTFDFREKVLRDVISAFGMPFLDPWFGANYSAGYLDPVRIRFLDECVNYVCGKGRSMPINVYQSSIALATEKGTTPRFSDTIDEFLGIRSADNAKRQNTVKTSELIQGWVAQPGGFSDLIASSMIFWGDHSIR